MKSIKTLARYGGILYLLITICAIFSMIVIPSQIISFSDMNMTAKNFLTKQLLVRLGLAAHCIVFLSELILSIILYLLLKPVNQVVVKIALYSRLTMALFQSVQLLIYFFAIELFSDAKYLRVFNVQQINSLGMIFLKTHLAGEQIWTLFFSLHCIALGFLILKSNYVPNVFGILFIAAAVGYYIDSFGKIILPHYTVFINNGKWIFLGPGVIGELIFSFWLIIKGHKMHFSDILKENHYYSYR